MDLGLSYKRVASLKKKKYCFSGNISGREVQVGLKLTSVTLVLCSLLPCLQC